MTTQVIGAGFMFLASGCGPILTPEQRQNLTGLAPDEFYPLEPLLEILRAGLAENPRMIHGTGRRWGAAIASEFKQQGLTDAKAALDTLTSVYQEHHQGDVGELTVEDDGPRAVYLSNKGPYPHELIFGACSALVRAMGAVEVEVEESDGLRRRISWSMED